MAAGVSGRGHYKGQINQEYLPARRAVGHEWNSGATDIGGKDEIDFATGKWEDNFPLFIRQGAIIPMMHDDVQYVGEKPLKELDVEVFPDTKLTSFEYYDDDGETYDYETGSYFLPDTIGRAQRQGGYFRNSYSRSRRYFQAGALEYYTVKIHGPMLSP